ncbi:MAG: hypothetical protein CMI12_07170 [Oceanospirillum sp.]|nr:hypothetical protein [Oceanospirillum sp.]
MKKMKSILTQHQKGFTLVELMIVVAIVGILAAVAVPQYQDYTRKAKLAELDSFAAKYKAEVAVCYMAEGKLDDCDNGSKGVSATVKVGRIASVTVTNGIIAVKSVDGLASDGNKAVKRTFTPTVDIAKGVTWGSADVEE